MIQDSGSRREFSTGAVRDIQDGKGRCDLLPIGLIGFILEDEILDRIEYAFNSDDVYKAVNYLSDAIRFFAEEHTEYDDSRGLCEVFLDVSVHFEEGSKKYGENNWQKGIPCHCYVDSAVRHYLKFLRGDDDEKHDMAFVWNLLCCMWTIVNKPELIDFPNMKEDAK